MINVAVAVTGGAGVGGRGSRRAVRWAVENLSPKANRFILLHVMPAVTAIPTPSGDRIPVEELDGDVVALYVQEVKKKLEDDIFLPFRRLRKTQKMESVVIQDDNPATAILRYVSEAGIDSLVLGSCSANCILRKLKGPGIPTTILKCVTQSYNIHVVSRYKVITKSANKSPTTESEVQGAFKTSSESKLRLLDPQASEHMDLSNNVNKDVERAHFASGDIAITSKRCNSLASTEAGQSDVQAEVEQLHLKLKNTIALTSTEADQSDVQAEIEQLRKELQITIAMYKRACEELVHTENKVQLLSSECLEDSRKVNAALEREETLRKFAAEEKAKYLQAMKEVEEAKNLLAKETYERQIAELNALRESSEKQKIVDAVLSSDRRYKHYTWDEIEVATNFFSENNVIGEGGYGKVYKCNLDHTPVAIKVFQSDAVRKNQEFLREIEVLTQLRHPHLVLLLGACPENGCLVYEYLENGSLDEWIFHRDGKPSLPWFVRFRIVFEVACGLAFLHNSKPDPIVHRDLKPGNILLDRNYVSKIGDVGLAKIISDVVPDNITEYRDSIIAGTFHYMDPEYQRTGTVRTKSDLYAFGIIVLQVLTARPPNGLVLTIENAFTNGSFSYILDKSVPDWPLAETEELAKIALKCSNLRCRDRPDLNTEVLPVLRRILDFAAAWVKGETSNSHAPSHYFCPILQEIMEDPYSAADGFTYEHIAIKAWLDRHKVSPVTKLRLQHSMLTPNHTLRSAIQEWRSRVNFQVP